MYEYSLRILLISDEALREGLSAWLDFWTYLVFIGVFLEIVGVGWEYWEERKAFREELIRLPQRPQIVKYFIEALGVILVITGIWGEMRVQTNLGDVDARIERTADALVDLSITRAGDAKTLSTQAADAAGRRSIRHTKPTRWPAAPTKKLR